MKKKPIADDYGDAPKMIQRQIIDPLTDKETAELNRQLKIAQLIVELYCDDDPDKAKAAQQVKLALFFVDRRIRLTDGLIKELDTFEKRFFATADQGLLVNLVDEAYRNGKKKRHPDYGDTAWEAAGDVLGKDAKTVCNQYSDINKALDNGGLPPLANSPKRKAKKNN
jgi:hypothetical protein